MCALDAIRIAMETYPLQDAVLVLVLGGRGSGDGYLDSTAQNPTVTDPLGLRGQAGSIGCPAESSCTEAYMQDFFFVLQRLLRLAEA